jgi:hypothetical protein
MSSILSRLTAFDWIKIVAYATAALTFLEGPDVLTAWGLSPGDAATWSHRFATLVTLLTLISNAFKNPSTPAGYTPAIVPNQNTPVANPATSATTFVTTADAVKKGP